MQNEREYTVIIYVYDVYFRNSSSNYRRNLDSIDPSEGNNFRTNNDD